VTKFLFIYYKSYISQFSNFFIKEILHIVYYVVMETLASSVQVIKKVSLIHIKAS